MSAMLSDAVRDPAEAGVKVMLMVQDAAAARLVPQLLVCENEDALAPVKEKPVMERADLPVFEKVTVFTALATPCTVDGKDKLVGERPTMGALEAGHLFTTLVTLSEPRPVARSKPAPAAKPERMPTASVDTRLVQFGEPSIHAMAIVPVSMSLKRQAPEALTDSVEHAEYVWVAASA